MSRKCFCWSPDFGQTEPDGRSHHVHDGQSSREAAIEWADWEDWSSSKYIIAGGKTVLVMVRDATGELTAWHVTGKQQPSYAAVQTDIPKEPA